QERRAGEGPGQRRAERSGARRLARSAEALGGVIGQEQLDRILERFHTLERELAAGAAGADFARKSKEYAELAPVAKTVERLRALRRERENLKELLADPEMADLAQADL